MHTLRNGWCYLGSVLDLYTKKIVGYAFSRAMNTDLAIKSVNNAYTSQKTKGQITLHSDLGSQYISSKFHKHISKVNIIHSFSAKDNPFLFASLSVYSSGVHSSISCRQISFY